MNVLFIHQNFPGQFLYWSANLACRPGHRVVALGMENNPVPEGVEYRCYSMLRQPADEIHPLLSDLETQTRRGEACAAAALQLRNEGFVPDLVIAHPGWGEALFIKDVFPKCKLVVYCEFFYGMEGRDVGFDPEEPPMTFQRQCRLRMRNTVLLHSLDAADAAVAPTHWQKSTFPSWAQEKITIAPDQIEVERLKLNPNAQITLAANEHHPELTFKPGDPVITYVARNLEAVRGFHVFMRTLPEVLRRRPNAHALIVGGDGISYGWMPPDGSTWRDHMLREVGDQLDMARVHFIGKIPYQTYVNLLHVSKVHTYWTTPFVLSWSFLEALAVGMPIVASDTEPVREFAGNEQVHLVPYFSTSGFCEKIVEML